MRQVTAEQWADHCSNFRTTGTEQNFRSGVSWLTLTISPGDDGLIYGETQ